MYRHATQSQSLVVPGVVGVQMLHTGVPFFVYGNCHPSVRLGLIDRKFANGRGGGTQRKDGRMSDWLVPNNYCGAVATLHWCLQHETVFSRKSRKPVIHGPRWKRT